MDVVFVVEYCRRTMSTATSIMSCSLKPLASPTATKAPPLTPEKIVEGVTH
jgi:hypothetical protein